MRRKYFSNIAPRNNIGYYCVVGSLTEEETIWAFADQYIIENKELTEEKAYELAKEFVTRTGKPIGVISDGTFAMEFYRNSGCGSCCGFGCWGGDKI